ncbi:Autophagy-related protein 13 homolog [Eumeta japonica]|uniref:Autophagy-related protein 13 n=1 Tax=Eumeta variegata TaxID=151549 RepID=A0A4C1VST7_EUMVA|nr:Autophagy-related protein 13 homolog [Eumeta japonica]
MAPDAVFSSVADRNEFTKFAKFLAYKGVQVIVESRKGEKIEAASRSQGADTDWFNLQIPDSPEVNQATKSALPSDKVLETFKAELHVEISVQTEDGDEMVLELWTFGLDETQFDPTLKAMNTVYFRMGILLKSLIAITRITPAYHLSRQQRTESFTIFYRVYSGEPKSQILGDSVKKIQVGMLRTPRGGIKFSVAYRTDLSISPNRTHKSKSLLLKSDHFELSPKHVIYDSKDKREVKEKQPIDLNKPLRLAAFVDEALVKQVFEEFFRKFPVPKCRISHEWKPSEKPVECKSILELDNDIILKSPTSFELPPKKFSGFRSENEPPLKLLYFPFADRHPLRELAEFYKEFFNAPHLKLTEELERSHSKTPGLDVEEEIEENDLSKDLLIYENSIQEFDDLLADMCRSAEWSGN